jgi:Aminotransferase class-V
VPESAGGTVLTARICRHVITQQTEHPAVLATCAALRRLHGVEVTYLPVDGHGLVDPQDLAAAITQHTILVSIMLANNETGTLQPITDLARIAHNHGVLLHTDAAQAVGKIPVDVDMLGADLLTVVGHKMYTQKGIAALYLRSGLSLEPVTYGGGQEHGLRAGTENVALAVTLGAAADLVRAELAASGPQHLQTLRDRLHRRLADALPGRVLLNGHPEHRLPNTLNLSITGIRGDELLAATTGVAASTGSGLPRRRHRTLARHHSRPVESEFLAARTLRPDLTTTPNRQVPPTWTGAIPSPACPADAAGIHTRVEQPTCAPWRAHETITRSRWVPTKRKLLIRHNRDHSITHQKDPHADTHQVGPIRQPTAVR